MYAEVSCNWSISDYLKSNTKATATAAGVQTSTSAVTRSNARRDLAVTTS
jgi:hypothetical protein